VPPVHKTSADAIVMVASELAESQGLRGVGVRAIAARLQVSPGTLYNVIGDIDDIVLRVNERTLVRLGDALLAAVDPDSEALPNLFAMADAYVDFVTDNPKLWSMLLEHTLGSGRELPDWYQETLNRTVATVDHLLRPLIADPIERRRAVAVMWATLEGTASLTASGKLSIVDPSGPHELVRLLIARFVGSFQRGHDQPHHHEPAVAAPGLPAAAGIRPPASRGRGAARRGVRRGS